MVRPTAGIGNYDLGPDPARAVFRACAPDGGRVGGFGRYPALALDHFEPVGENLSDTMIGVIDTGLVLRDGRPHPWLAGRVQFDPHTDQDVIPDRFQENSPALHCHGTFVTGRILLEAPSATVRMIGVLDRSTGEAEDQAIATAIETLAAEGIQLINLSFCGDSYEIGIPKVLEDALNRLGKDVVVVAAAGNLGQTRKFYPAALWPDHAKMIAVGAVDETEYLMRVVTAQIADFSNHGAWVDVYSSGVDMLGPYRYDEWAWWSGTSFAAATVTGAIARTQIDHPEMTMREAANKLLDSSLTIPAWDANGRHDARYIPAVDSKRKRPDEDRERNAPPTVL